MLLAQTALRGGNKQLVVALMNEGLANLQTIEATPSGLPAVGALDTNQLEQWYTAMRDSHRKRKK